MNLRQKIQIGKGIAKNEDEMQRIKSESKRIKAINKRLVMEIMRLKKKLKNNNV